MSSKREAPVDPRAFVRWFLDSAVGADRIGGAHDPAAQRHLIQAVMFYESGRIAASLQEANRAGELDAALRPLALVVARMCVRAEIRGLEP